MDNISKIAAKFGGLRNEVNKACATTLNTVMPKVLEDSLSLHANLEEGRHRHHLVTRDTHAYAVAHGDDVLVSGNNDGEVQTNGVSALERATTKAADNKGEYKGSFVATMDFNYLSARFETKVQETLINELTAEVPKIFKETALAAKAR